MKTLTFRAYIGEDGILKIEMPTSLRNTDADIVMVLNPMPQQAITQNGYPTDFFDQIDSIDADDLIERPNQGFVTPRDDIE